MAISGFGKAKYSGGGFGNQWKPKEGDNHIRVLPPMHTMAEDPQGWARYVGIHFGYCGNNAEEPTRPRVRPFKCIEKKQRNGMVEQECPACNEIEGYVNQKKELEAKLIAAGKSEDQIKTELAPYTQWLKDHNVDRKHYMNVMIPTGEFGHFTISHKTKKALQEKMKEVAEKKNIDPTDIDEGVWFNIKRTGKMLQAVDTVEFVYSDVEVGGTTYQTIKKAPLSEVEQAKALAECKDLATVGHELTFEQIEALVASGGDPDEVDKVFGGPAKAKAAPAAAPKLPAAPPKSLPKTPPSSPASSSSPAAPPTPATPTTAAQDPAIAKRIADIKAKKAMEAARAQAEADAEAARLAAQAEMTDPSSMSDEDFLTTFDPGA